MHRPAESRAGPGRAEGGEGAAPRSQSVVTGPGPEVRRAGRASLWSFQSTWQSGATRGTRSSPSAKAGGPGACLVPVHNQGLHSTALSKGTEP